jgi:hypothetical protein
MNCQTCRIEIEELGMNERLAGDALAHLSGCLACRAFHDERQSLKQLVGSLAAVSAPPDFDFRLRARISAGKNGAHRQRSSWRAFLASAPAIGLAASFALLVAGFVFYNQMKSGPAAGDQPGEIARQTSPRASEGGGPAPVSAPADPGTLSATPSPRAKVEIPVVNAGAKGSRPRLGGKPNSRPEARPAAAPVQPDNSNDFAGRGATVVTPAGASPLVPESRPVVELSIRSASRPVRVFVDDRSGAKRTVTLEPVVFGSQDFTGRNTPRVAPSSQGIW